MLFLWRAHVVLNDHDLVTRDGFVQVLIREICNSIIAQAVRYINGGDIFTMISSEETVECYAKLENTSRICTAFKAGHGKASHALVVESTVVLPGLLFALQGHCDQPRWYRPEND